MNGNDRMAVYLARVRQIGSARSSDADYGLYERLKREFVKEFPAAAPEQYEAAVLCIARAAGV